MSRPIDSPFHAGEAALQTRAGVRDKLEVAGRSFIRSFMPEQHRAFFPMLPFLVAGALDRDGQPWASILAGPLGFTTSPDPETLTIAASPFPGDPLAEGLKLGAPVGLLGIQLETRRRNRMNGRVVEARPGRLDVRVNQSFGNCPQYIQAREPSLAGGAPPPSAPVALGPRLGPRARALVAHADTFFIASASPDAQTGGAPSAGVDVSHRGGRPGFVRVSEEGGRSALTFPDFRGNNMFNTLGNLVLSPRAGLLFVDFATGGLLQLAGEAEVIWDGPEVAAFEGARRLLVFRVAHGLFTEHALPLRWSAPELAPQLLARAPR